MALYNKTKKSSKLSLSFVKAACPLKKEYCDSISSPKETVSWIQEIPTPKLKREWLWNFFQITLWRKKMLELS